MKKLAVLLTAIGLSAVAPFATASEDGLDLMPKVSGVETTSYIHDVAPAVNSGADEFYARGTGGISPQ
jgi:hypothetical protein